MDEKTCKWMCGPIDSSTSDVGRLCCLHSSSVASRTFAGGKGSECFSVDKHTSFDVAVSTPTSKQNFRDAASTTGCSAVACCSALRAPGNNSVSGSKYHVCHPEAAPDNFCSGDSEEKDETAPDAESRLLPLFSVCLRTEGKHP